MSSIANSRPPGSWSHGSPAYLTAVRTKEFNRAKEEWIERVMRSSLEPSHRVIAYFIKTSLNWATMDVWKAHSTLAKEARRGEKTVQRALIAMESEEFISIWRQSHNRHPVRYAPRFESRDAGVLNSGQVCPSSMVTRDHLSILSRSLFPHPVSRLSEGGDRGSPDLAPLYEQLSFGPLDLKSYRMAVAKQLGHPRILQALSSVSPLVALRLCEAFVHGAGDGLAQEQLQAARLAAHWVEKKFGEAAYHRAW